MERRLAAILVADVAGYSRMMEVDEAGTLARLKAHLSEIIEPRITVHHGNIVKTTGDGLLAEFASIVAAVECAVEIQRSMAERNVGEAEDQQIRSGAGYSAFVRFAPRADLAYQTSRSSRPTRCEIRRAGESPPMHPRRMWPILSQLLRCRQQGACPSGASWCIFSKIYFDQFVDRRLRDKA